MRLTDEGDTLVAEVEQVRRRHGAAGTVVDRHAGERRMNGVEQDGGEPGLRQPLALVGPQRQRHDDQTVELLVVGQVGQPLTGSFGRIDDEEHDFETVRLESRDDATQPLVGRGSLEEVHEDADVAAVSSSCTARGARRLIVELVHRLLHPGARLGADLVAAVQDA